LNWISGAKAITSTMVRALFGVSMLLSARAEDVCASADCESSAMVQRVHRKVGNASPLTQLLQATTRMLRDGSTPAVLEFTKDTLKEIDTDIITNILKNHQADQDLLDAQIKELEAIIAKFNGEVTKLEANEVTEESAHTSHKECRGADTPGSDPEGSEAALCDDASKKNWERAEKWTALLRGERKYEVISTTLHGRFCPPTGLTWHSKDLSDEDINAMVPALQSYRTSTVTKMMKFNDLGAVYFRELIPAWQVADTKADRANTTHMNKKTECEGLKTVLETSSCTRAQHHADFIVNFEIEWTSSEDIFNKTKEAIVGSEKDRKRECVTLEVVKCLLKKIELRNGTKCNSTDDADEEIKDCETKDATEEECPLTIDYPCAPEPPVHPIIKVFPGQPKHYWEYRYSAIESHGFCFTNKDGVVDKVNNQFPMTVIHNKNACPLAPVDAKHLEFPLPEV